MKTALYDGTFDPPTIGHLDIIRRAAPLYSSLIVGVAADGGKKTLFTIDERIEKLLLATKELPNVQVAAYQGLTWQFAKKNHIDVLIRSLRPGEDSSVEFSLAAANRELGGLETLFLAADPALSFISSSLVREILQAGGSAEKYLA